MRDHAHHERTLSPPANPDEDSPFRPESGAFLALDSDDIDDLIASGAVWMPPRPPTRAETSPMPQPFAKAA